MASGLGKLLGLGMGIATGNPMQIAGALASGTQAGNALGLYNMGSSIMNQTHVGPVQSTGQNFKSPEMGSQFTGQSPSLGMGGDSGDALSRRLSSPENSFNQGWQALHDPTVPSDVKMMAAPSYYQAVHLNPNNMFAGGGQ